MVGIKLMRTRETISAQVELGTETLEGMTTLHTGLCVELLLDIRELLQKLCNKGTHGGTPN